MAESWEFQTRQVHAGAAPDQATGARATPIFATTSFVYESADSAAASFQLDDLEAYSYSRVGNPTTTVVERRIADLEGGVAAVATASGQAATALALLTILRTGDHVVAARQVYGGTANLLDGRFRELGITATWVDDVTDLGAWRDAVQPSTRAFFAETIGNPTGAVLNIESVAAIAHASGVPLIVDNTLATPYLLRPLEHGADIVVHSTTKFLAGHGTAIGGIVVDGGTFDFGVEPGKWPGLHEPEAGRGDRSFWDRFGVERLAYSLRLRTTLLRDFGPAVSPFNSFLLLQGIETLSLRIRQHVAGALAVVEFLRDHPLVERVYHPTVPGTPWAATAARLLPDGGGSIVAFDVVGGANAGRRLAESLRLFSHLANIGDVRSLVIHPASTTHSGLDAEAQATAGIGPGLVRLSIGIEDPRDIVADLERGLAALRVDATSEAR